MISVMGYAQIVDKLNKRRSLKEQEDAL